MLIRNPIVLSTLLAVDDHAFSSIELRAYFNVHDRDLYATPFLALIVLDMTELVRSSFVALGVLS